MGVKRGIRLSLAVAMLVAGLALLLTPAHAQAPTEQVYVLTYDGNIDPNAERYFSRGIRLAEEDGAPLVVIKLDTPGGLLSSTEKIVEHLLGADVPVAVYVYPPGAFAASAGTFVTAAANFAVMAEGTSIGAAAPVSADGEDLPETLSEKATNITVAMAEGIAEKRGRDKEALTKTITEAEAYTASAAVEANLVDFVAVNMEDLLEQLDGQETETASGVVTMETEGLVEREVEMSLAERFFGFVGDPNVIGLLLTFGALGLFVELLSPGLIVPGVVGGLAMIIGLVALGALPFNWAGIVLLALAAILIFFEIQAPGLGFLGGGRGDRVRAGHIAAILRRRARLPRRPRRQDKPVACGDTVGADSVFRPVHRRGGGEDAEDEVQPGRGESDRSDRQGFDGPESCRDCAADQRDVECGFLGRRGDRGGGQCGGGGGGWTYNQGA